jgi:hypothetical protein
MKITQAKHAKGAMRSHLDIERPVAIDRSPKGLNGALKEAMKKLPKPKTKHQRKKEFRTSVFKEQRLTSAKNIERWLHNEAHSIIETPENRRRNMIRAAYNNVIRKENYAKKAAGNL